jgi:hypothetical protein
MTLRGYSGTRLRGRTLILSGVSVLAVVAILGARKWANLDPIGVSSAQTSGSTSVTVGVSSPATACDSNLQHIFITLSDVQAANPGGASVDLTPQLRDTPQQVDLLNPTPTNECFVSSLGSGAMVVAANYQQLVISMLANASSGGATPTASASPGGAITPTSTLSPTASPIMGPANNACAALGDNVYNCVQDGYGIFHPLNLPQEASSGLTVAGAQILGGSIDLSGGSSATVDVAFNGCEDVSEASDGSFNFLSTIHAGVLGTDPVISGTLVTGTQSGANIMPGNTAVPFARLWLEQPLHASQQINGGGPINYENLISFARSDENGEFVFCPVPPGSYDIVADTQFLPSVAGVGPTASPTSSAQASPIGTDISPSPMASASTVPTNQVFAHPSSATITSGISVSASMGYSNLTIPLIPENSASIGSMSTAAGPGGASVVGEVTVSGGPTASSGSSGASGAAGGSLPATIRVWAGQLFTIPGSSTTLYAYIPYLGANTVPIPPEFRLNAGTAAGGSATGGVVPSGDGAGHSGTATPGAMTPAAAAICGSLGIACTTGDCGCYQLQVPAGPPVVGAASSSGNDYMMASSSSTFYTVDALANLADSEQQLCSPSELTTPPFVVGGSNSGPGTPGMALAETGPAAQRLGITSGVVPGPKATAPTINFVNCAAVPSPTPSPSASATPSPSASATPLASPSPGVSPSASVTVSETASASPTPSAITTGTASPEISPTATEAPTATIGASPLISPTATASAPTL